MNKIQMSDEEIWEKASGYFDEDSDYPTIIAFARAILSAQVPVATQDKSTLKRLAVQCGVMYDERLDRFIDILQSKPQATTVSDAKDALKQAYGYLWLVNNGKDAPPELNVPSLTPEEAAYEARKLLREMLTREQRGEGINFAIKQSKREW